MPDDLDKMFAEVVSAVRQGQRTRAKDLLSRLLRADQGNAEYWVWMSAVVDSPGERQYCLQQALKLKPDHPAARRGLILIGGLPADQVIPIPPPRRKWSAAVDTQVEETPKSGLAGLWQKLPLFLRARPVIVGFIAVIAFLGLGIGGCLVGALMLPRENLPVGARTAAPVTPNWDTDTPTPSLTPTSTPLVRTATPTLSGATPLSALLAKTYTSTPRYIATPHNISEAYRSGLSAYDKGDYEKMLRNMQQASTEMPAEADVAYYRAEALRKLGQYEEALDVYSEIIEVNPAFAPAYLGRARAQLALKDSDKIVDDLDLAIQTDLNFVEAYLERAAYQLKKTDLEAALQDLQSVEDINPDHPWLYYLRAQVYLQSGEQVQALDNAQRAFELDRTLLPVYLVLGQAYLANDQPTQAHQYIHDYLVYEKEDAMGWLAMGMIVYRLGDNYSAAIQLLDKALELNDELADAYHYRGLTYLALEDTKSAINDLVKAVQLAPKDFQTSLDLGIALFTAERNTDAVNQLGVALKLAETDAHLGAVYHWRSQIYQTAGNIPAAIKEWEALLALPKDAIPSDWLKQARQSLLALTPTPEATTTATPAPVGTDSAIPSPSVTATP